MEGFLLLDPFFQYIFIDRNFIHPYILFSKGFIGILEQNLNSYDLTKFLL